MSERSMYLLVLISWSAAVYAAFAFVGTYLAPDSCLDAGGSFNYAAWECSRESNHQYLAVAITQVPGFWIMAASVSAALLISAYVLRRRLAANNSLQARRP